jgi:head-tail adaptor
VVPVSEGSALKIKDRKHRVIVCSQKSDVDEEGRLLITRAGVIQGWAAIEPVKAIRFSRDGVAMQKNTSQPTHDVTMNYNPDVNISVSAWIYEHRLKSPPRWFKVLSVINVDECSQYMKLRCRLVEANDDVTEPVDEKENGSLGAVKIDIPL